MTTKKKVASLAKELGVEVKFIGKVKGKQMVLIPSISPDNLSLPAAYVKMARKRLSDVTVTQKEEQIISADELELVKNQVKVLVVEDPVINSAEDLELLLLPPVPSLGNLLCETEKRWSADVTPLIEDDGVRFRLAQLEAMALRGYLRGWVAEVQSEKVREFVNTNEGIAKEYCLRNGVDYHSPMSAYWAASNRPIHYRYMTVSAKDSEILAEVMKLYKSDLGPFIRENGCYYGTTEGILLKLERVHTAAK